MNTITEDNASIRSLLMIFYSFFYFSIFMFLLFTDGFELIDKFIIKINDNSMLIIKLGKEADLSLTFQRYFLIIDQFVKITKFKCKKV
jgi:hypothetical protein